MKFEMSGLIKTVEQFSPVLYRDENRTHYGEKETYIDADFGMFDLKIPVPSSVNIYPITSNRIKVTVEILP